MMSSKTAVVLFTRDLRATDNPALWAASRAERTVPLFVLDDAILGSRFAAPNRVAYMREALIDLDGRLKAMDARLFLRRGQVVEEAMKVAREVDATSLHLAADWSAYARRRERRLRARRRGSRSPLTPA
jgi:deoxyribodipyrimidine photo-lyase